MRKHKRGDIPPQGPCKVPRRQAGGDIIAALGAASLFDGRAAWRASPCASARSQTKTLPHCEALALPSSTAPAMTTGRSRRSPSSRAGGVRREASPPHGRRTPVLWGGVLRGGGGRHGGGARRGSQTQPKTLRRRQHNPRRVATGHRHCVVAMLVPNRWPCSFAPTTWSWQHRSSRAWT